MPIRHCSFQPGFCAITYLISCRGFKIASSYICLRGPIFSRADSPPQTSPPSSHLKACSFLPHRAVVARFPRNREAPFAEPCADVPLGAAPSTQDLTCINSNNNRPRPLEINVFMKISKSLETPICAVLHVFRGYTDAVGIALELKAGGMQST